MNPISYDGNTITVDNQADLRTTAPAGTTAARTAPVPVIIACLMRDVGPTGLQTHVRTFRQALQQDARETTLATPYSGGLWKAGMAWLSKHAIDIASPAQAVRWHRHSHERLLAASLRQHLAGVPRCVIYAQCPVSARAALRARHSPLQAVVMAVHFNVSQADEWVEKGTIPAQGSVYRAIRAQEDEVLPRLDGVVFVSQFMREQLQARMPGLAMVPSVVLPNFVIDPGPPPMNGKDRRPDADLISIGSLEPRKNQAYLLEILAAARQAGHPLSLTLAGDGPDREHLRRYAQQLGVAPQVNMLGHVQHGAALLRNHRGYIHAATMENMPLTLIESLSYGKPLFAPAVGGIPEVFADGVEGRYLPLDNADRAARIVLKWLHSPEQMARAAVAARRRFLQKFESAAVSAGLVGFLDSTVP